MLCVTAQGLREHQTDKALLCLTAAAAALRVQAVLRLTVAERRIQCATLHVDASNTPALGLYGKAGFVKVSCQS